MILGCFREGCRAQATALIHRLEGRRDPVCDAHAIVEYEKHLTSKAEITFISTRLHMDEMLSEVLAGMGSRAC